MTDLTPLISRLEAATGGDREIDALIVAHLHSATVKPYPPSDDFGPHDRWQFWSADGAHFLGSERKLPVPTYTASLDAALSLLQRVLPGWGLQLEHGMGRASSATVGNVGDGTYYVEPEGWGTGPTPALALLAAIFAARQTKERT